MCWFSSRTHRTRAVKGAVARLNPFEESLDGRRYHRAMMKRPILRPADFGSWAPGVALSVVVAALAACGGDDSTGKPTTAASDATAANATAPKGATATPTVAPIDVCKLLTAEDFAGALSGLSAPPVKVAEVTDGGGCRWTTPGGEASLAVTVRRGEAAQKEFEEGRAAAAAVAGFTAEGGSERLQAFRVEAGGASKFYIQRADVFVTLELRNAADPGRPISARALAARVMARLAG